MKKLFITYILIAVSGFVFSQTYNMSNTAVTTCSGTFYDSGGSASDYSSSESFTKTFTPSTAGNMLEFAFTAFDVEGSTYDYLRIYDGPTTGSPIIGIYNSTSPGTITATNATGQLTFEWISDGSVTYAGWEATISCVAPPTYYPISNTPITTCSGIFTDNGNIGSDYNGSDYTQTYTPGTSGQNLQFSFTTWSIGDAQDWLKIYDGPNTASPLIGTYNAASGSPGLITATSGTGQLTFEWLSDNNGYGAGWAANISCVAPPPVNDLCANATTLNCGDNLVGESTVSSTNVADPLGCASNYGVWYTFVGDGNETTISSTATFDHEMVISSGSCGSLTSVICDDGSTGMETHTYTTVNGTTYFVYIAHYSTSSITTGTFDISRTCPTPCSGTPAAGTATPSPASVCSGDNSTITLSGYTSGTGITYQWQSATAIGGPYSDIAGATSTTYIASPVVTTYYQCVTTCTNSGLSNTSSIASVSINAPSTCYCSSTFSNTTDEWITNVTFNTINNNTGQDGADSYGDYTALSTDVTQGSSHTISVTFNSTYTQDVFVWFDWNQDGDFEDAGEEFQIADNTLTTTNTLSIPIPLTATVGSTRMRVMTYEFDDPIPCQTSSYGETEDYTVNIVAAPPCSGTPTAGTATASPNPVCVGSTSVISLSGYSVASGITFQWESSPTGGAPWTSISGATSTTYTTPALTSDMYYHCVVSCTNSGLSATSTSTQVVVQMLASCYCASSATSTSDMDITNITFGTINNTSPTVSLVGSQGTATGTAGMYSDFWGTSVPIPDVYKGQIVPFSVTIGGGTPYSHRVDVYIDFNQDGDLTDAGESFSIFPYANPSLPNTTNVNITIPNSALDGHTLMRVVCVESSSVSPCGTYTWGETEDYTINIVTPNIPMAFASSTTTQTNTSGVAASTTNAEVIGIQITTTGYTSPLDVTSFSFNTTGTTNAAADISNATLWYSGTSNAFSTATQVGAVVASPNGTFTITGTQSLSNGINYFWLTYDVTPGATLGNFIDAECTSLTVAGSAHTPTTQAPTGNREIVAYDCDWILALEDYTGDGWDGQVEIFINGSSIGFAWMDAADGVGPVNYSIPVVIGDEIFIDYTAGGVNSDEDAFFVYDSDGWLNAVSGEYSYQVPTDITVSDVYCGSACSNSTAFCNDQGYLFPATVDGADYGDIGCLATTPNPAWYFMEIDNPGDLVIDITSSDGTNGHDVDFIAWGPFASVTDACGNIDMVTCPTCPNNTTDSTFYPFGEIVDCSYSAAAAETVHISGAQTGEIYVLLITNYSNQITDIEFAASGTSTATTNCSIVAPPVNNNGPVCMGATLELTVTYPVSGATYNWEGPGGWFSTDMNPTITNVTTANAGVYSLVITAGGYTSDTVSTTVTVLVPATTGLVSGDYVWAGLIDTDWLNASNWLEYDGSGFAIASVVPSTTTNVFLRDYGICPGISATIGDGLIAYCKDLNNETDLTMGVGSTLRIYGDYNCTGTFTAGTGTVAFRLGATQSVKPGGNAFYNFKINKTAGTVVLDEDVIIGGDLTTSNATSILNTNAKYITLSGNMSLNASTTYTNVGATGILEFNGTANQNYNTGTGVDLLLNNVLINNSGAGISLFDNLVINTSGSITFTNGIVHTNAFRTVVNNTAASAISAGNSNSYIDGELLAYITSNSNVYNFPVGDADQYALARLGNHNLAGTSYFTVNFYDSFTNTGLLDPTRAIDFGTPYIALATNGLWEIIPNSQPTGGTYDILLTIDDGLGFDGMGVPFGTAISGLVDNQYAVLKRDHSSDLAADWFGESIGTINANNGIGRLLSDGYASRYGISSFSDFALGLVDAPLAIDLLKFDAECYNGNALLTWDVASEINTQSYIIEKSHDAKNFKPVQTIDATFGMPFPKHYDWVDSEYASGKIAYYKLNELEFDGDVNSFSMRQLDCENDFLSGITPRQIDEKSMNVQLEIPLGEYQINVYDNTGKLILNQSVSMLENIQDVVLKSSSFTKGMYLVLVQNPYQKFTSKIIMN